MDGLRKQGKPVRLASSIMVVDSNERVLLTKRGSAMRTFPNGWVLPGGSVDPTDTSWASAGLRELEEETGLSGFTESDVSLMFLWESSCDPPPGTPPATHMLLAFYILKLPPTFDPDAYLRTATFSPREVSHAAWVPVASIHACTRPPPPATDESIPAVSVTPTGSTAAVEILLSDIQPPYALKDYGLSAAHEKAIDVYKYSLHGGQK
eukprot:TRINITY_DN37731_c0_g1_i1.p1 TRINITY_DN37731_c0_g1~~TRINITY_DN37731_c0_g1_i1.p1  ORF type:complete len:244 (+),score=50.97 TRINITY_DN37731_c0_g1_i1:109-732(+)